MDLATGKTSLFLPLRFFLFSLILNKDSKRVILANAVLLAVLSRNFPNV